MKLWPCQFQIINSLQFPSKTPNTVQENTVPGFSRFLRLNSLSDGHYYIKENIETELPYFWLLPRTTRPCETRVKKTKNIGGTSLYLMKSYIVMLRVWSSTFNCLQLTKNTRGYSGHGKLSNMLLLPAEVWRFFFIYIFLMLPARRKLAPLLKNYIKILLEYTFSPSSFRSYTFSFSKV